MRHSKIDLWLVIPALLLSCLSLLLLASTTPDQAKSQALFLLVTSIVFIVVSQTDSVFFFATHKVIYLFSLGFLLLPFIAGISSRGANRWLQFDQFSIQPSEIVKPFLLITFAVVATSSLRFKLPILILLFLLPAGIIFLQPDLGTSLILAMGWLTIFISRTNLKKTFLAFVGLVFLIFPVYSYILLPYQQERLQTFINPYTDPLGRGYHVIQSIIAVGSGNFWGRGLGHGTQSELQFLPENHTDFIFASIGESFGFFGSFVVILLYLILLGRIYRISQSTSDPTVSIWTLGILSSLAFQIFINIGMNIGLAPVTGITLPLLSYGGSSLLSVGITLGLLNQAVAKQTHSLV